VISCSHGLILGRGWAAEANGRRRRAGPLPRAARSGTNPGSNGVIPRSRNPGPQHTSRMRSPLCGAASLQRIRAHNVLGESDEHEFSSLLPSWHVFVSSVFPCWTVSRQTPVQCDEIITITATTHKTVIGTGRDARAR
jgi:hypothetical protein